jgi:hypothetical protein
MGAALGLIGPMMSIGGALFGGGSTANNVPQAPPVYQPTGQAQADQSIQSGIQHQQGAVPQADQAVQYLYNNPGAPGAMSGANTAGAMGQAAGMGQFLQGQNLTNTGNSVVPYAYSALNAGFDPQGQVYNQQFQQNTDQTRALMEARGIDSTPYGAGVESQSNMNFNNAWLQNTLARQGQGAATANSLFGTQTNDVTQGQNLSGMAPGTFMQGASMPYNTAQTIGTNQINALGQGQGIQQTPLQNWMQYMQLGQGAAGVGTQQQQTNLNQNQMGWNQNQQLGSNLGAGMQGLAKGWGNFSTPGWAQGPGPSSASGIAI